MLNIEPTERIRPMPDVSHKGAVFTPGKGEAEKFTRRANGGYAPVGRRCGELTIGRRRSYLDPTF